MKRSLLSSFFILFLMLFLISSYPVLAAEHVVTNLDGGFEQPGSLRNVLLTVVPGDVITFHDGLSGIINLTGQIWLTHDITIQGPGSGAITLSGFFPDPASLIAVGPGVNAEISGLSFIGANAGIQYGGAISNAGDLRLAECLFQNNHSARGGAISNSSGFIDPVASMDIVNCQFLSNQADWGGAIYNDGTLNIVSSDLYGNIASTQGGGALFNYQDLVIENSELINNQALSGGGGAIVTNMGKLTLNDTLLNYNEALNNGEGGAIYSRNAEGGIFLIGCTLDGNKARNGGAIRNYDQENYHSGGISLSLTNCILKNNEAQYGGGIFSNPKYNKTILTNCIIADNTATESAGGIYNGNNQLEMRKCTVSGNIAGSSGGGIYNTIISDVYALRLWNSTITGNIVSSDPGEGGGAFNADGTFQTSNCTITGNSAPKGGGLSFLNGYVVLKNTIVAFNEGIVSKDIYVDISGPTECAINNVVNNLVGVDPDPASWFGRSQTNIVLSDDIASTDVFSGIEEGPEVGAPGNTEKMQVLALKVGSIAIDNAHWFDLFGKLVSEDQRGVSRPQGEYNDIGAYELIPEPVYYSITTTTSAGGSIDPVSADVLEGTDVTFTVTAYDGYILNDLLDGGTSVSADIEGSEYTLSNVLQDHNLNATFIIDQLMKEDAGISEFDVYEDGIGSIPQGDLVQETDVRSIQMERVTSADVQGSSGSGEPDLGNFVSGVSFDITYSNDEGTDIFALDVTLEISKEDLGQDTCDSIDDGDDLSSAFFENVSIYKVVSDDFYDLFGIASLEQDQIDPVDFFDIDVDESSYYVSLSMVIEDNAATDGEDSVEAIGNGLENYFYVYDGEKDGKFSDPILALRKSSEEPVDPEDPEDPVDPDLENGTPGSGGGCNMGAFTPVFGLLIVPLMFLMRR